MAKICIVGFGCIGSGTYEIIRKNARSIERKSGEETDIKYIEDIRDFSSHMESRLFTDDFDKVLNDDEVSVVVETIGGIEPAYSYTKAALERGKSVVTSNKELVAIKGDELFKIAADHGVKYLYEASVGGGIPIIRPILTSLGSSEIDEISGILNGTTNYILTEMFKNGRSFGDALKEAQRLGYAERNPSADVDGFDTGKKISILSSMVIGKKVNHEDVHTVGITAISSDDTKYAEHLGYSIKLIGRFKSTDDGYEVFVEPMLVKNGSPLASVEDVFNGIFVKGDMVGEAMFYGRGAGKLPTASAVVADVIEAVRGAKDEPVIPWTPCDKKIIKDYDDVKASFLVRTADTDSARAVFGTDAVRIKDGECAFVTDTMSVCELDEKLAGLDVKSRFMFF